MAVTWQCAAGYDPSAEAGTQFAFAAVLPEGYALLEGVSLPEILVTLTPPLANAMLMAEGIVDSGEGWTLSDDGTLTVTGYVMSSTIESFESAVKNIEVTETGMLSLETAPFLDGTSGSITIAAGGYLTNYATISGGTVIVNGIMENTSVGSISGGTFIVDGRMNNQGTITEGTFTVNVGGTMENDGSITRGTFTVKGTMSNLRYGTITGGAFGKLHLYSNSCVQGEGDSVPTVNGHIENVDGQILQPCNFGAGASVEKNTGTIEVSATVNGASKSLFYGEKTLEQLKEINANDVWFEQAADGTQARVTESATVDLVSRTYVGRNLPAVEAPQAVIDFAGETVTVSLAAPSALPQAGFA